MSAPAGQGARADGAPCANCGTALAGAYCHACGQKRFAESDRRFGHLLHQFLVSATDLDGRLWRTLRALLLHPGLLGRDYIAGRRAHWLTPMTLFLAVNVAYFLAPLHGGDLALQFDQQVSGRMRALAADPGSTRTPAPPATAGQAHTRFTEPWIERRVQARDAAARTASHGARGYGYRDYRLAYDAKADDVSKALVMLHVPFVALALALLFAQRRCYFAEHFVVALHFVAFALLALLLVVQARALAQAVLPAAWVPSFAALDWPMRLWFAGHAVLALRRAYGVGWLAAFAGGAGLLAALLFANLYVYRTAAFLVTFALT
jgi:hypothetical protein